MPIGSKLNSRLIISICSCIILSACNSPHDKMVETMSKQTYCFEKATAPDTTISLPDARLHLQPDHSLFVTSTDQQLSEITGEWDLCCWGSDYGNYVFKIKDMPEWTQANPDFYVLRNGIKVRLFFRICK